MSGKVRSHLPEAIILAAIALYVVFYSFVSIHRHQGLNSSGFDLAISDQVVWNTSRGRLFSSSIEVENFLGDHVAPIVLLLAPLAWLPGWGVEWLLVAQAVAIGAAAWPLYHLARLEIRGRWLPVAVAISYLASPLPGFINRFDFHFLAMSVPCLTAMLLYVRLRRLREATVWAILAILCREEVGIAVGAVALVTATAPALRKWGLFTAAAAIAWSLVACFVIIPWYRGAPSDSIYRYGWLGENAPAIAGTILTSPLGVLRHLFSDPLRVHTLGYLLWPLALLPFFAPARLLGVLVVLAIPMLQDHPSANTIYFHYLAPVLPLLWWAAIGGAARLCRMAVKARLLAVVRVALIVVLMATTSAALIRENLVSKATEPPLWEVRVGPVRPNVDSFRVAKSMIEPGESVVASMALAPHLARRPEIGIVGYARTFDLPDCYLLDVSDFRWADRPGDLGSLLRRIIGRKDYAVQYWDGDIVLLRRNGAGDLDRAPVLSALDRHLRSQMK